jgi:hypothetical protein
MSFAGMSFAGAPFAGVPFVDVPFAEVSAPLAAGSGAVRARLVAGFGATRAVPRAPVARVVAPREVVRPVEVRAEVARLAGVLRPVPVAPVFEVGSAAGDWAVAVPSEGWFGAGDAVVDESAGASEGDRPLPVSAERGAGVLRRLLVRVARRPF